MDFILIYVTYGEAGQARSISKALVEARLVACANIFQAHESMYWWEGTVQNENETAVIYKTRTENFEAIEEKIKQLHSYKCPCIVVLPITNGHLPFLDWVKDQTKK